MKPSVELHEPDFQSKASPASPPSIGRKIAKPINFYFTAPEAQKVCLMGDFNGWNPLSHPMEHRPDGWWFLQVPLPHGHHQYLFMVDGVPTLDPHAVGTTRNLRYKEVSLIAVS